MDADVTSGAPQAAPVQRADPPSATHGTGVLPSQAIRELLRTEEIVSRDGIADDQIQPASLDLRLGDAAYRVRASFLPGPDATVEQKVRTLGMHRLDLSRPAVLERGCVYIVPLRESLALSARISAFANPKSSTGRLDIFTRLIADGCREFDRVPRGYKGPLYAEIAPRTFSVVVRSGDRLNQLRLRRGAPTFSASALRRLHQQVPLISSDGRAASDGPEMREDSIGVTLDLRGHPDSGLVGFRAKHNSDVIDVALKNHYDPLDFWEPIHARRGGGVVLNPDDFYILATREAVCVPPDHAAEMVAYDTLVGEFRVHYAGFFDPGFGYAGDGAPLDATSEVGSKAVLEVRSHDVPFMLEHGQVIGWLRYERLTAMPDIVYGRGIGSSYQGQALKLAKQFKQP